MRSWLVLGLVGWLSGCRELPEAPDGAPPPPPPDAAPRPPHSCGGCGDLAGRCGAVADLCGQPIQCGCLSPATCGGAGVTGECGVAADPYGALADDDLRTRLHDEVANQTALGYDNARTAIYVTPGIDVVNGTIECLYTGTQTPPDGTRSPGNLNTEHVWPQSLGASVEPARSDMHHLFPVDALSNSYRNNHLYGWAACGGAGQAACRYAAGGSQLGPVEGGTALVFQVRPERRGDAARASFYFSVRYQLPIDQPEESTLREWNQSDPPDDLERSRNLAVDALQHNKNPFIDRPDLVTRISDF